MLKKSCMVKPARPNEFVYLHEVDPTIRTSLRYYTNENFIGSRVHGYTQPVVMVTHQAALALQQVQVEVQHAGYSLVVYDAYRPQRASDQFMQWSKDAHDQLKKAYYYPRVDKKKVFELGYVGERSGHSRGSTVDVTLIENNTELRAIRAQDRLLLDGYTITFLDDGTVDMGSHFDLFDTVSYFENDLIEEKYKKLRMYLKNVMEKQGFNNYPKEWWHFTLKNEPFPADRNSSYFDCEIQ